MRKRILAMMAVIALGVSSLSGCGNSGEKEATTSTTDTKEATTDEAASTDEVITLNFPCIWVGTDSKAAVFGKMVEGFNQEFAGKYQVVIEEQTDYDFYRDKIRTSISTGAAPDIFTSDSMEDLKLYAESGKLMDLTEFLGGDVASRFTGTTIEDSKIDGANYAMPYEMAVVPIMFNKKLLNDAGITAIPTSYDELWTACDALKAKGVFPTTQMTNDNAWTSMLWYSYAVAACGGADVYSKGLEDPAFLQAAEIMQKMFTYTSSDAVGADASVVNGHFFNERAAIYVNGSWILGRIKTEGVEGLYDNLELSPGLSKDGQNGGAYVNAVQAYFAAGKQDDPKKQEAVEAFFEYITNQDRVLELANSSGSLFAIDIDATKIENPLQATIVEQSQAAPFMVPYFQVFVPTAVANAFPSALEALVLGDITPEGFIEQLQAAQ